MGNCDPTAVQGWLKDRYVLLYLRINERTDHAFAIVDLPDLPSNPPDQSSGCKISLSTPHQAESDSLRMPDFDQGTTFFDSKGWKKRLLEISHK
jgi:hypothetical protein